MIEFSRSSLARLVLATLPLAAFSPCSAFAQASDIQPFQAEEVRPYQADKLDNDRNTHRAPRRSRVRSGNAVFEVPSGWMISDNENVTVLRPARAGERFCAISILPAFPPQGALDSWFQTILPTLLMRDRVLEEQPLQPLNTSDGRQFLVKLMRVRSGGRDIIRQYVVARTGSNAQVMTYEAEGAELFRLNRSAFNDLLKSIEFDGVAISRRTEPETPQPQQRPFWRRRDSDRDRDEQSDRRRPAPQPAPEEDRKQPRRSNASDSKSFFFRTFGLAVPGVAYSFDNYATNTRTNVVSAGALTRSSIRINADHTFDWNSAWDGKIIHGRWVEHEGGILLQHAQEGKDWLMQRIANPPGKAEITLSNGSIWYDGTPLK